jgi:hypothetical protein|tara:strand:+ start:113 stop:406 length:294 start_codon:yes stop_codon:yes gene_type:complete
MTKYYDRFDLESAIQTVWQTKDDLDLITQQMVDDPEPMTEDDLANVMVGLSELHDIRCKKLFSVFETMLREKSFTNTGYSSVVLGESSVKDEIPPKE